MKNTVDIELKVNTVELDAAIDKFNKLPRTKCIYCQTTSWGDNCPHCGAPKYEVYKEKPRFERMDPFGFNGYVIWPIKDWARDIYQIHFYLGDRLVDIIEFTRGALAEIEQGIDPMYRIWDLFLLSQGEEEVIRIKEQNKIQPCMFEIRRVEI